MLLSSFGYEVYTDAEAKELSETFVRMGGIDFAQHMFGGGAFEYLDGSELTDVAVNILEELGVC